MNSFQNFEASLLSKLAQNVAGEVIRDPYHCSLYSTDASLYQIQPCGVLLPKSAQDVQAAVQWAAEHRISLVPRGGGTSLSGQSVGPGLVIDFSKYMNRILDIDPKNRTVRIQPGVVLDQLNTALKPHQLIFGPDVSTSSRANLGGMIGNNSAGARSIHNGKTVDHVIELNVVLADGTPVTLGPTNPEQAKQKTAGDSLEAGLYREIPRIVAENQAEILARFPKVLRRVSGYNLDEFIPATRQWYPPPANVAMLRKVERQRYGESPFNLARLVTGAEGTLAVVTEALVHAVPLPPHRGVLVLHFESLAEACAALDTVLSCGPSAVEFFDKLIIELAAKSLKYRDYLDFVVGVPESLILVEFSAQTEGEIRTRIDQLQDKLRGQPGLYHVLPAMEATLRDHIWECRKAALPLLMSIPGTRKPIAFVEDTAVDPVRLPEFVARFRQILYDCGTDGAFYGHASVGCMHVRPLIDAGNREDLDRLEKIADRVCDLVIEFGGSMSGEHGDGLARSFLNERLFGSQLYQAFKQVKHTFDPNNLMNPGKVVDGPSPVESLRQGADYHPLQIATTFDYSRQGGFVQAVELCNGSGVCRKTQTGTMCPSFMVTRDEEHTTRGRANALRLVLSGALPKEELTGDNLKATFDLCLQCKGCKAECPSNVDVAKMKAELLQLYYKQHGTPASAKFMGNVATWNRRASRMAPLSNLAWKLPGARWLQEQVMGVDRRRPMPHFEREDFATWFSKRTNRPQANAAKRVVLLDDCLTSFCEPGVNRAAAELLEAAGYEVSLAGLHCCGRAHISKGLLDEAKTLAEANIQRLLPLVEQGLMIVGSEPSCILTLLDDYRDLVPGEAADKVAAACRLVDQFLVSEGLPLEWKPSNKSVVLHGHCHQKALVGTAATKALLQAAFPSGVQQVDSGCCGMAGSFGYEHYDLSMAIGERVLFPAVRTAGESEIAAPGFSCRHQIEHGTGRQALHPLELAARQLRQP